MIVSQGLYWGGRRYRGAVSKRVDHWRPRQWPSFERRFSLNFDKCLPGRGHQILHKEDHPQQTDDQQDGHQQHEVEGDASGEQGKGAQVVGQALWRQVIGVAAEVANRLLLVRAVGVRERERGRPCLRRRTAPALRRRIALALDIGCRRGESLPRLPAHQGGQGRADEAAARDRRQVVDVPEEALPVEGLEDAEIERRRADSAAGEGEAQQVVAGAGLRGELAVALGDEAVARPPTPYVGELVGKDLVLKLPLGLRCRPERLRHRPRGVWPVGLSYLHAVSSCLNEEI